jgi:hypothetical protein
MELAAAGSLGAANVGGRFVVQPRRQFPNFDGLGRWYGIRFGRTLPRLSLPLSLSEVSTDRRLRRDDVGVCETNALRRRCRINIVDRIEVGEVVALDVRCLARAQRADEQAGDRTPLGLERLSNSTARTPSNRERGGTLLCRVAQPALPTSALWLVVLVRVANPESLVADSIVVTELRPHVVALATSSAHRVASTHESSVSTHEADSPCSHGRDGTSLSRG